MEDTIVVGGGIGGLAVSLALRARGASSVVVLEQAEAIREVGAGLQISPNGLRVLEALGLAERFRAISVRAEAVSLRDGLSGREVTRLDVGGLGDRQSYRFVHRADLVELLANAAREAGVEIRLSQTVAQIEPGTPSRVILQNGAEMTASQVVAADGLHSVARPVLNGPAQPFFTGQVAWRAVVPNVVDHPAQAWVHMGPKRHMVSYPLRDGQFVNLVAVEERREWAEEGWAHTDDVANLRHAFRMFTGKARELIDAVEAPGLWGLFRHPVAARWHDHGVALLGDAAHPTLPFLAQGANMALEDAWTLAAADGDLARYQSARRDRVVKVIEAANGNAWKYHLSNPVVRGVAHLGLGMIGRLASDRLLHQFDWLYQHDVTQQR
ncbi:FAD-dependent monooxygenase [Sagittula marina]|nr:FAD-dependent monooxygenase [Sagittula marina]